MNWYVPGVVNVTVVGGSCRPGSSPRSGATPWTGSVPVRWRSWTAASPTIHSWSIGSSLRRTIVTGTPAGTRSAGRLEVGVVDRDLGRRPGQARQRAPRPPAIPASPSDRAMPADQGERARGRRCASHRCGPEPLGRHRQRRAPRGQQEDPADAADGQDSPTISRSAVERPVRRRPSRPACPARPSPRRRAGPGRVDREVEARAAARRASMLTLVSQAVRRHPVHPAVGAQVVEQRLGRRRRCGRAHAVVAGRGRAASPASVGQEVDVGLDALARRSCRGPGSAAGPTGSSVGIVMWTGVPSPTAWPRAAAASRVERGGEEDRRAGGVEVEHLGRVGREAEAVVGRPRADRRRRRRAGR